MLKVVQLRPQYGSVDPRNGNASGASVFRLTRWSQLGACQPLVDQFLLGPLTPRFVEPAQPVCLIIPGDL